MITDEIKAAFLNYMNTVEKIVKVNEKYFLALQEIKKIIIQEKVTNNKKLRAILDLITKATVGNE